jgi:hypothetical protein
MFILPESKYIEKEIQAPAVKTGQNVTVKISTKSGNTLDVRKARNNWTLSGSVWLQTLGQFVPGPEQVEEPSIGQAIRGYHIDIGTGTLPGNMLDLTAPVYRTEMRQNLLERSISFKSFTGGVDTVLLHWKYAHPASGQTIPIKELAINLLYDNANNFHPGFDGANCLLGGTNYIYPLEWPSGTELTIDYEVSREINSSGIHSYKYTELQLHVQQQNWL